MTKIVSSQSRIVQVRPEDLDLARRRNPNDDADTQEAVAVALAALRNVHGRFGPGIKAAMVVAAMLPAEMQKRLGHALIKAH